MMLGQNEKSKFKINVSGRPVVLVSSIFSWYSQFLDSGTHQIFAV